MRRLALLFLLAGCSVAQQTADEIARDRARVAVNQVVDRHLPGANVTPVTDCIINEASAGEILSIARDSVSGVDEGTVQLVLDISRRPDALACITRFAIGSV